jgi:hypothetical protein
VLYNSTSASFKTPYGIHDAVERLRAVTKPSAFGALTSQAAVGRVSETDVSLQRVIPSVRNPFKPCFVGRFEATASGTRLVGRFTMPWVIKVLVTGWSSFCFFWTAAASWFVIASGNGERWYFPLVGVCMLVAGGLVVKVGTWFGRNDVAWLTGVISGALSASTEARASNRAGF